MAQRPHFLSDFDTSTRDVQKSDCDFRLQHSPTLESLDTRALHVVSLNHDPSFTKLGTWYPCIACLLEVRHEHVFELPISKYHGIGFLLSYITYLSSSHCLFHSIMTLFRYNIGKKEQQATKAIGTTTQLSRRRLACFVRFSLVFEASKIVNAHSL